MGAIRNTNRGYTSEENNTMIRGVPYNNRTRRKRSASHPSNTPDSGYDSLESCSPSRENPNYPSGARDSGYSSLESYGSGNDSLGKSSEPQTPPEILALPLKLKKKGRPFANLCMNCDGNSSEDEDQLKDEEELTSKAGSSPDTIARPPARFHRNTVALPVNYSRPRPALSTSLSFDTSPALPRRPGNSASSSWSRLPDRFIPARPRERETQTERYRTRKPANQLTRAEKLLRHKGASEDAFCHQRRVPSAPMFGDLRDRGEDAHHDPTGYVPAPTVLGLRDQNGNHSSDRQISYGAVWSVGGAGPGSTAVNNGRGQLVTSSTNARHFQSNFSMLQPQLNEQREKYGARIAAALGLDRAEKVLRVSLPRQIDVNPPNAHSPTKWNGVQWVKEQPAAATASGKPSKKRKLPFAPFKVLDAPSLRDDFYCSVLAFSYINNTLAIGLGDMVYGWSEHGGVQLLNAGAHPSPYEYLDGPSHITSVAFSSTEGESAILAIGRSTGMLSLMSLKDKPERAARHGAGRRPRFELPLESPVSCLSWRPCVNRDRPSRSNFSPNTSLFSQQTPLAQEDLLVGTEEGRVLLYAVEWPSPDERELWGRTGGMTLLLNIQVHSQQICGLAWNPKGDCFATGANDNLCCLFDYSELCADMANADNESAIHDESVVDVTVVSDIPEVDHPSDDLTESRELPNTQIKYIKSDGVKYKWRHAAAVKAIAFCPWQDGLVATGGGSNDKCIHFFHTKSGSALATISVSAQVTSLIWSTTRREIVATFGYASPEHPVRIAVFSWPDCRQVAAVPWPREHRALYAIPYPCGPEEERRTERGYLDELNPKRRYKMEGCIMVAASDNSVRFHEVWGRDDKVATIGGVGMLGGSDILEGLQGIDKEGDVIR
ncbi:putative meiotic fizzy-related protein [Triangularia verruculosa]|uniref:Meiotic fizzy-related protein n=1 Tax=Triangularia verruculosa TaxID=2587418 RepID=A0AAN6XQ48_9PEZI|nr:putative meiotic fizzy-related protein [Triangularia verruculosa]